MAVEAKLRISPQLDAAAAALRKLAGDVKKVKDGAEAVDKPMPKLPAQLEAAAAGARKLASDIKKARDEKEALDKPAPKLPAQLEAAAAGARKLASDVKKAREAKEALDKPTPKLPAQLEAAAAGARKLARDVRGVEAGVKSADKPNAFANTRAGLDGISARIKAAHQQLLAFFGIQAGYQAVVGLARMADQYQGMNARLRIVTRSQEEFNIALASGRGLAAQYNAPLNETLSLYTRLLAAVRPLGGGTQEATVATEAMLASLKISGASAAESASAILQYSQALGSGVLRGEEFNAINEAAPRLLDALAAGLGRGRGELKALAEQGQLTTSAIVAALRQQLPQLRSEAALIPTTIGSAAQAARDALQQFVGKETQGAAKELIALLRVIAENISTIAAGALLLTGILGATALGRGVAGLIALGGGMAAVTGAASLMTVVMKGLLALLGGPVGIVVAVVALPAARRGVAKPNKTANTPSNHHVRHVREAVRAEIEELKKGKNTATYYADMTRANARLRRLDAEFVGMSNQLTSAGAAPRFSEDTLRNPAAIKKFEDEYKTRTEIVKKYADERATYIAAKDKEIAAARARGDEAAAKALTSDKVARLAEQARKQREELRGFDTRDAATRLAQSKNLYNKDLELLADATQRERKLLQEKFDQGLVDLQAYLVEKARLQDAENDQETRRLKDQLAEEQRVLGINQGRLGSAKDANARETVQESITASMLKISELNTEIEKKERDRRDNARALADEAQRYTRELRDQQAAVQTAIKQAMGTETPADIARRVQDQFQGQVEREFQLGGDGQATQRLIDITVLQEVLGRMEREFQRSLAVIRAEEDATRIQQEAGALTIEEAERRILDLRRAQIPALQGQAAEIGRVAERLGKDEQLRAKEAGLAVAQLNDTRTTFEKEAQAAGRSGLGQLFSDIVSGSKQADSALQNMLSNFRTRMANLIGERLGNKLFESFGLGKAIDSGVSFLTSLFGFHEGGIAQKGNASFTRSINVSPFALAMAPRFHSGYTPDVPGLARNEVLAVLEDDEEVLTSDNPRHIRNYRGAGGVQVSSSVTVNGAGGDERSQRNAGADLNRAIEDVVDRWAVNQSRPGGILFKG